MLTSPGFMPWFGEQTKFGIFGPLLWWLLHRISWLIFVPIWEHLNMKELQNLKALSESCYHNYLWNNVSLYFGQTWFISIRLYIIGQKITIWRNKKFLNIAIFIYVSDSVKTLIWLSLLSWYYLIQILFTCKDYRWRSNWWLVTTYFSSWSRFCSLFWDSCSYYSFSC